MLGRREQLALKTSKKDMNRSKKGKGKGKGRGARKVRSKRRLICSRGSRTSLEEDPAEEIPAEGDDVGFDVPEDMEVCGPDSATAKAEGKSKCKKKPVAKAKAHPKAKAKSSPKAKAKAKAGSEATSKRKSSKGSDASAEGADRKGPKTKRPKKGSASADTVQFSQEDLDYMVYFSSSFDYLLEFEEIKDQVKEYVPAYDCCGLSVYWSRPGCGVYLKKPGPDGKKQNLAYFGVCETVPDMIMSVAAGICLDAWIRCLKVL